MKRLHIFLLKSFLGPVILTFFISLFILLMQFLWKYIDDLAGKGLDWTIIAELILYVSARLVPMALPLAILLSSIMTFGNLGENFELTAVKSAGVSLQRFMAPLIILTVALSFGAFFYSNHVIPYSNLKAGALLYSVKHARPELQIVEGIFYNGIDGFSIKIGEKDHKTNLLKNVMIYDHREDKGNVQVTVADSGYMKITPDERYLVLTLYNGHVYEEIYESTRRRDVRKYPHQRQKFSEHTWIVELTGIDFERSDEDMFKNNFQMLKLSQLESAIDSLGRQHRNKVSNFSDNLVRNTYYTNERDMKITTEREEMRNRRIVKRKANNRQRPTPPNEIEANIDNTKSDTIQIIKIPELYLDTIFNNLKINKKIQAVTTALTHARNTQSTITTNKKTFLYKLEHIHRHEIEWHRKFSLSFACLVFFFIGAPFGAIIRKGGFGTPVVLSIFLFILYYMISITGEKFAREGVLPSGAGMWLSSFILMPLGIFLTYKATTDSSLLNLDAYTIFFSKLIKRFKKKSEESRPE